VTASDEHAPPSSSALADDDDGDESDPEDSETPWACALLAHRTGGADVDLVRVKVATLSPTPHHPKVVAALKVPFPLPDIDVEGLSVRKRIVTPAGIARPAPPERVESGSSGLSSPGLQNQPALMLTAEEIKDIVSSTGMWLVVREGIGGVGRVSRKGDGWRLRA
jgi:hypothetical protein